MDKQSIFAVVRAAAQAIGGSLVASGMIQASQIEALVGGVVVLASVVWSICQKKGIIKA